MSTAVSSVVSPVLLHAGRVLRGWTRTPAIITQSLGMPLMMLLVLVFMFRDIIETATGQSAIQGLVPLMMTTGPMFAGAASAAGLVTERKTGLLVRFRTLPGATVAPLAGRVLAESLRGMTGVVILLAVGFLLGYRVGNPLGIVGILAVALLMCVAVSSPLTWVGMVAATPEATVAALPVMMILMFCNVGFMPVEGFPSWMHGFVRLNPLSRTVEAMDACAGNGGAVLPAVLWLVGMAIVGGILISLASRRED
jgi:ABC-2 type transport system permease protein